MTMSWRSFGMGSAHGLLWCGGHSLALRSHPQREERKKERKKEDEKERRRTRNEGKKKRPISSSPFVFFLSISLCPQIDSIG
jgi:hypothetical protein